MRTAALAIACLVAASAIAGAAEPPYAGSASPYPVAPSYPVTPPQLGKIRAPNGDLRGFASEPGQPPRGRVDVGRPPRGRVCFNQSETREEIAAHRLADPLRAMRAGRLQGDALSAKLCRWRPDEFVYEIHVLRRDGRVLRVYMNAQNGEAVGGPIGGQPDKDRN